MHLVPFDGRVPEGRIWVNPEQVVTVMGTDTYSTIRLADGSLISVVGRIQSVVEKLV